MQRNETCFVCAVLALGFSTACLPADTRPPPATVALQVSPNDASQKGVTTTDGWSITIERFLVDIGDASVGDACISYSDAGYQRLLDATRSEDQKLALLFGLGQCDMDFRISGPASDTILGTGVSETDALLQGLKGTDKYIQQESGISIGLRATAKRGTSVERIDWSFRQRIRFRNCETPLDGKPTQPLDFQSNANLAYHIVLHPEVLLQDDDKDRTAVLRFDAIASADAMSGNADGEVTLDELDKVSLDAARQAGPYGVDQVDPAIVDPSTIKTLEDYIYLALLPKIPQFREPVVCSPNVRKMMFD
jgi:hypothetical protein